MDLNNFKRELYSEDEIVTLEFDDGDTIETGCMGIFDFKDKQYIALEELDGSNDVYLYRYIPHEDDYELGDIPESEFDEVKNEFDRIMDEPIESI